MRRPFFDWLLSFLSSNMFRFSIVELSTTLKLLIPLLTAATIKVNKPLFIDIAFIFNLLSWIQIIWNFILLWCYCVCESNIYSYSIIFIEIKNKAICFFQFCASRNLEHSFGHFNPTLWHRILLNRQSGGLIYFAFQLTYL